MAANSGGRLREAALKGIPYQPPQPAGRPKREQTVEQALTRAARRFHAARHAGPFDECPSKTCYHTHPLVIE